MTMKASLGTPGSERQTALGRTFGNGMTRKASIKETGEELSQAEWERFDAAVADEKAQRPKRQPSERDEAAREPQPADRAGDRR